ncbi:Cephalosporin hydroxylase [Sulfitobacter noctilucicola]|uniref:Cephalosporin hydroxylase n=1 Tax=Sulfitobacter noctilucicola TaxID=1342301 RepID=A0A7W6M587_9RHOB|nr:CmcI family methyltransferase [Sulfitobacter noctilucicola]KIN62869.1 Cephalosporin hydroxylase [Sulfitobacter noctilucicola]MBB4172601.1 cephalosporin hydroxylase [Sulfitobacter noctilucicola]
MIRSFKTPFTRPQLGAYHKGVMHYHYRDVMCNKSPIDIALYLHLFHAVKPGSFIEIGTKHGGSALMFRDVAKMYDFDTQIVTIDTAPPDADDRFDGISFVKGDVMALEDTFTQNALFDLPRPWILSEDSAHTYDACMAVLDFGATHLKAGEYLIMEDSVLAELDLADRFDGGPSRALEAFLTARPDIYEIDTSYCDMFGVNATTNPNGYLRRL